MLVWNFWCWKTFEHMVEYRQKQSSICYDCSVTSPNKWENATSSLLLHELTDSGYGFRIERMPRWARLFGSSGRFACELGLLRILINSFNWKSFYLLLHMYRFWQKPISRELKDAYSKISLSRKDLGLLICHEDKIPWMSIDSVNLKLCHITDQISLDTLIDILFRHVSDNCWYIKVEYASRYMAVGMVVCQNCPVGCFYNYPILTSFCGYSALWLVSSCSLLFSFHKPQMLLFPFCPNSNIFGENSALAFDKTFSFSIFRGDCTFWCRVSLNPQCYIYSSLNVMLRFKDN